MVSDREVAQHLPENAHHFDARRVGAVRYGVAFYLRATADRPASARGSDGSMRLIVWRIPGRTRTAANAAGKERRARTDGAEVAEEMMMMM